MSTDDEALKRRYREFLDLLPLTLAIAGLPLSQGTFNFSNDQMEVRSQTVLGAFKMARQAVREAVAPTPEPPRPPSG